jgi:hypothetical protein
MSNLIAGLASGFIGGIIAWFATNYYGRNLLRFWDQRLETHKTLFFQRPKILFGGREVSNGSACMRLAAEIDALRVILPAPLHWYLRKRGYDLHATALGLTELSNSLGSDSFHETAAFRVQVQDSLRLPVEKEDRESAQLWDRLRTDQNM